MSWDYGNGTPGELAEDLLHRLTDRLRPGDQAAIVTYGSTVATPLGFTAGADQAAIHAAIDALSENGSTNMEAGLARAYELGAAAVAAGRPNVRLILFTDVQPNVGATTPSAFEQMVTAGAEDDVHLTVLALGTGIGPEVFERIAPLRGANGFSLMSHDDVTQFVDDEHPWFTMPIAYDLTVAVAAAPALAIDLAYGFPGDFADEPELAVASVFLSKRRGALLVSLAPDQATDLDALAADLELGFVTPAGAPMTASLHVDRAGAPLDERGHWFEQPTVARTTALALLVSGMRQAAAEYELDHDLAEATMQVAHDRFVADAAAIADPTLDAEVELASAMLSLIVADAPQGTLYGDGS
jgi:Ca-activated chloride channel family protein